MNPETERAGSGSVVKSMDPRIRIRTIMSRIRYTVGIKIEIQIRIGINTMPIRNIDRNTLSEVTGGEFYPAPVFKKSFFPFFRL